MHDLISALIALQWNELASIVGVNAGYVLLTFLPPLLWLLFYLREDTHPEPKRLILLTFLGGIGSAFLAIVAEVSVFGAEGARTSLGTQSHLQIFLSFAVIGYIEEYAKYLPVKFLILKRADFNEPIDAMIYMMTSALGFAAIENALFIFPLFHQNFFLGLELTTDRFLGANLLHALSSGIVGFFLARAWFRVRRAHYIAAGMILAALLHAGFNYFILIEDVLPEGAFYVALLLSVMAIMVLVDFERLKRSNQPDKIGTIKTT